MVSDNSDSESEPVKSLANRDISRWTEDFECIDTKSFIHGMAGISLFPAICIVCFSITLALLDYFGVPQPPFALQFAIFGIIVLPVLASISLLAFLPFLLPQRFLTKSLFVAVAIGLNLELLLFSLRLLGNAPLGRSETWTAIAPSVFVFCVSISSIPTALQWIRSQTLLPNMLLVKRARPISIGTSLELVLTVALGCVAWKLFFSTYEITPLIFILSAAGFVSGLAAATMTYAVIPTSYHVQVGFPCIDPAIKYRPVIITWATAAIGHLVLIASTADFATWSIGGFLAWIVASMFNATIAIAMLGIGIDWLRRCGWTLERPHSRDLKISPSETPPVNGLLS
ncbi:MAG: hypothetical protein NXI28_16250 [bacterium]|nr:hypothetical protein [bacterium]